MIAAAPARADDLATSPARPDYEASEKLLMWKGRRALEDRGLTVDGTYTSEVFGAPQLADRVTAGGLFTLEIDAELSSLVSSRLGTFHLSAFAIHGTSPTEELMDVHGVSGNSAPRDVRLFEAWLDQPIGPVTLRAGLVAADQQLVIADQSQTLLAATFGITGQFSANLIGPVYPVATPGVTARLETERLDVRAGVYDGTQDNWHGIPRALGPDLLACGEVELDKWLAVGAWHHTERGNAVYAIADRQVTEHVGAFARIGVGDGPVTTYVDAGLRGQPFDVRPDDLVSLGIAFARTEAGAQTIVEGNYEMQIHWLTVQPAAQVLFLPGLTVGIAAVRTTVTF
jgi:carbohydrate-selective porin OprB